MSTSDDVRPHADESYVECLAAYDDALAAGRTIAEPDSLPAAPQVAQETLALLVRLNDLRPRDGPALACSAAKPVESASPAAFSGIPDPNAVTSTETGAIPTDEFLHFELPCSFGDYDLMEPISSGGMGVIYKARQRSLNRVVAVKMIRVGHLAGPSELRRFRREAEAVARLDHPHIVPVYEVGQLNDLPYFSMKLMEGGSLEALVGRMAENAEAASRLVAVIARAVHHAHQHGILHRDLKPSNVLLDAEGRAYVGDFGLARRLEEDSSLTQEGAVVGTPSYMAPEQASGHRVGPTTATDVYGLGAILYALLTGRPPFRGANPLETLRQVIDLEPPPPRALDPKIDRDLEAICLKALEKQPGRRYPSAYSLAEDIEHWLAGETIRARRIGRLERITKWAKRRPAIAAFSGLVVLVASAGLIGMFVLYGQAVVARGQATARAGAESEARKLAVEESTKALRALESSEASLYANRIALADRERSAHDPDRADALLDECPVALRDWEWRYLKRRHHEDVRAYTGHEGVVRSLALSPDGRYLVSVDGGRTVHVRDRATSRVLELQGHPRGNSAVAFSPDGQWMAVGGGLGLKAGEITLWRTQTWSEKKSLPYVGNLPNALEFSPDSRRLVAGHRDNAVRVWDIETMQLRTLSGHTKEVEDVAFSPAPKGRLIASASRDATIRIWDAETGALRAILRHERPVFSVAFDTQGRLLASSTGDVLDISRGDLTIWDVDSARIIRKTSALHSPVHDIRFSPSGSRLATAGWDRVVRIWDSATLNELLPLLGHAGRVWRITFSPDGHQLLSGAEDGSIRCWDAAPLPERPPRQPLRVLSGHDQVIRALTLTPDGRRLISAGEDHTARVWDVETGRNVLTYRKHPLAITALAVRPDGRAVASGGDGPSLRMWDPATGKDIAQLLGHTGGISALAFHPDGKRLFTASADGTVRIWDAISGQPLRVLLRLRRALTTLAISPDGYNVSTGGNDGPIFGWNLVTDRQVSALEGQTERVVALTYHPNSYSLAAASADGTVRTWDATGMRTFDGARGRGLAWSPDGQHFATSGADRSLKVWEFQSGRRILSLRGDADDITCITFTPDGRQLVTAGWDRTIKFWDATPEEPDLSTGESRRLLGCAAYVWSVVALPDGRRAVSCGDDGFVRVWDLPNRRELRRFTTLGKLWVLAPTPDGKRVLVAGSHPAIRVLDLDSGREILSLVSHEGFLFAVAVTPDGRRAVSGGGIIRSGVDWKSTKDTGLRVWDLQTGRVIRRLDGHQGGIWSVSVSPDGRRAASASLDGTVRVWDLDTGALFRRFEGHKDYWATVVAFLPDGKRVLSGGTDYYLRLWDIETGQEIRRIEGARGPIDGLAIAADGRHALSSGIVDHNVRLWNLETGRELYHYEVPHISLTRGTFTRDGRRAIWGASDGVLRIWDIPERFAESPVAR